jgi:hypothetical protein
VVSGKVRRTNGTVVASGTVQAFDSTESPTTPGVRSEVLLGTASLSASGSYSITYSSSSFSSNGVPHTQPNLLLRVYDTVGQKLAESDLRVGA